MKSNETMVEYQEKATSRILFPIFASLPGDSEGDMLPNNILCCKALSYKKVGLDVIFLFLHLPEKSQTDFTIFRERNKKYKMKFSRSETAQCAHPL